MYLARLKFQPRTRRISATPVAKRFKFASEQYFPRSIAMFGLISGIIMSLSRARPMHRHTHTQTHTQLRILSIFKYYSRILDTGSHVPVLTIRLASFFFSFIEINRGRWIDALRQPPIFYFYLAILSSAKIKLARE